MIIILIIAGLQSVSALVHTDADDDSSFKDYSGHSLLRIIPQSHRELVLLRKLYRTHSPKVDFWREPLALNQSVDIFLSPDVRKLVEQLVNKNQMQHHFVFDNLQSLITVERKRRSSQPFFITNDVISRGHHATDVYRDYNEIMEWLDTVAKHCSFCSVHEFGSTYENRSMKVLKISDDGTKPIIFLDAGIHAREWIAPATAIYVTEQLIKEKQINDMVRSLLEKYTIYILPLANPDGYHYTWTKDRLWRKTRSTHPTNKCRGADPNRNWHFHWGGKGTSSNPCNENFRGTQPFSEKEVLAMAEYMWTLQGRMNIYLSLHSYGQYWLTPWGYTYRVPTDFADLMQMGSHVVNAIKRNHGIDYTLGSSSRLLYLAAGGSDDWVKGVLNVKYSYTVELADTGRHGFILPPQYIESTGRQMFDALLTLALGILGEFKSN